jgi:L-alanine-DL-glutamate epimerase-like enolase superfamily enzyme
MEPERVLDRISAIIGTGGRTIKLKIGMSPGKDLLLIRSVRERFGDSITISLDANQGFSAGEALGLFEKLAEYDIQFIEQPVPADDLDGLKMLHESSPVPVMADESVCSLTDLEGIVDGGICDRVNLKLMKSGGLYQLKRMIEYCSVNDIGCQIGCMIETPVGISAGVHLGLSSAAVKWTDLDGHMFLGDIENIFKGLKTAGDINVVSCGSGLGLDINEEVIKRNKKE